MGGLAVAGGMVAFLMLIGLFPSAHGSWLAAFSLPARELFGWGTALALLGALLVAGQTLACVLRRPPTSGSETDLRLKVRGSPGRALRNMIGAGVVLWLALVESRLLWPDNMSGLLAGLGAMLVSPLPGAARHMLVLGGMVVAGLITLCVPGRDVMRTLDVAANRSPAPQPHPAGERALPDLAPPRHGNSAEPAPGVALAPGNMGPGLYDLNTLADALRIPTYLRRNERAEALANTPTEKLTGQPPFALPPLAPRTNATPPGTLEPTRNAHTNIRGPSQIEKQGFPFSPDVLPATPERIWYRRRSLHMRHSR